MFSVSDADLSGRVLDCPGGGASFTATAGVRGADAVAVDPVYAAPAAEVADRVVAEVERGSTWAQANADRYVWGFYGDLDGHARLRAESARLFSADLLAHPERYAAAALPHPPFNDDAFDLVLSSHLLEVTWASRPSHDVDAADSGCARRDGSGSCRGCGRARR